MAVVTILCSCQQEDKYHHRSIRFTNNLNVLLYVDYDFDYPDTVLKNHGEAMVYSNGDMHKVSPKTQATSPLWNPEFYEVIFRGNRIPSDTITVFVFDSKKIESNPVEDNEAIIQYYYLSLPDLKRLDWKISYPPS
ncbi:MAG: hypothetical protein IMY73_01760, partial [Bacteroidetes bacterium]|nr:hypothetical protein [Bacteroidota bacterium]